MNNISLTFCYIFFLFFKFPNNSSNNANIIRNDVGEEMWSQSSVCDADGLADDWRVSLSTVSIHTTQHHYATDAIAITITMVMISNSMLWYGWLLSV